jgi:hypothetical protein
VAADCGYEHDATACGMTGLMLFPFGKLGKLAKALVALKYADEAAKTATSIGSTAVRFSQNKWR